MDDHDLVRQAQHGDQAALARLLQQQYLQRDENGTAEPWEGLLREGLDELAAPVEAESPPDLAAFIMLVQDVQREQRQVLRRDLLRFLTAAVLILFGGLWTMLQFPVYYLVFQSVLAAVLAVGAALWRVEGRSTFHE